MKRCGILFEYLAPFHLLTALLICRGDNYFWHIADTHYDPDYWTTQATCNVNLTSLGMFGDYECDAPWSLVESSVQGMLRNGPTPMFIFWTGDSTPHQKVQTLTTAGIIEILRNTTDLLKSLFAGIRVLPTLGNHDYYPDNQLPPGDNALYDAAYEMWAPWFNSTDTETTFRKGAYYTVVLDAVNKIRAVVLNTNLYNSANKQVAGLTDPADQFSWLEGILQQSRQNQEKVHLIMHIPPGAVEVDVNVFWMPSGYNQRLNDIIVQYSDVFIGIYSAHTHLDSFRLFYNATGSPVASMLIAPSVTPWRARIPSGSAIRLGNAHNPAIRKISFDKPTRSLVDVSQYYLDLPQANAAMNAEWKLEYTFRQAYGINDVTTASLQIAFNKFKVFASDEFHSYYLYNTVDTPHPSNGPCNCICKEQQLCAIGNVQVTAYGWCIDGIQLVCSAPARLSALLLPIVASVMCLMLFMMDNM